MRISQGVGWAIVLGTLTARAQPPKPVPPLPAPPIVSIEQPDAQRTREEFSRLLERYPPTLKGVFALDPTLLSNPQYLAPYPALVGFLNAHPEIARNAAFYVGAPFERGYNQDRNSQIFEIWRQILDGFSVFAGFAMAIGLLTWLIRTFIDNRRWNRLAKVQTDMQTKILDRFTANDDLLAYIQSPAGSKFLQAPVSLDTSSRSVGAPLGRILWSVQAGLVLMAAGLGLRVVGARAAEEASQPIQALGVLGIALGVGLVVSAIISFVISHRLGLIEPPSPQQRTETPGSRV